MLGTERCLLLLPLPFSDEYREAHKRERIPSVPNFSSAPQMYTLKIRCLLPGQPALQVCKHHVLPLPSLRFSILRIIFYHLRHASGKSHLLAKDMENRIKNPKPLGFKQRTCRNTGCVSMQTANPTGSRRALCLCSVQGKVGGMSAHLC